MDTWTASEEAYKNGYNAAKNDFYHEAKWIDFHVTDNGVAEELCRKCGEWTIGHNKRFCPNCGAKMDKVTDDE